MGFKKQVARLLADLARTRSIETARPVSVPVAIESGAQAADSVAARNSDVSDAQQREMRELRVQCLALAQRVADAETDLAQRIASVDSIGLRVSGLEDRNVRQAAGVEEMRARSKSLQRQVALALFIGAAAIVLVLWVRFSRA